VEHKIEQTTMAGVSSASSTDAVNRQDTVVEHATFAVMGVTGAGKSSFIKDCTKQEVKVGNSLTSCKSRRSQNDLVTDGKRYPRG
jgi:predicted GTPase